LGSGGAFYFSKENNHMPTESLRPADAYSYAKFRSTLAESDSNVVLSRGNNAYTVLPVLIEDGGTKLFVELEYRFYDPEQLPNFVRFELRPEERANLEAEKAAAEAEVAKPKNFQELQARAEQTARNTMAERHEQNKATNSDISLNSKWSSFAQAAERQRNAAFRS
jgi:hypothetical protein